VAELTMLRPDEGPRSKRAAILAAASRHFGQVGYEATKWSTIAEEVGIGQTALYHYFESKAHCLLTIMTLQLEQSFIALREASAEEPDPLRVVEVALARVYDVTPEDILRLRLLHSNMSLLATPRSSAREEAERRASRELIREFESEWTKLLARGMETGQLPSRDPRLLARAVLGLVVSVWSWFRPGGEMSIQEVGAYVADSCRRMITT
jgi:TetR/AcrR family transcriptional regulator, cholesterol catabolism regulator